MRAIFRTAGPGLIVQEAMYGFIMALIFITAARVGLLGDVSNADLLILIVGMNLTWGAIDMIVFFLVDEGEHYQMHRFLKTRDPGKYTVQELLDEDFAGTVLDSMYREDRQKVYDIILASECVPDDCYRLKRGELLKSAISAFVVTSLTIVPFVICLLLIPDEGMSRFVSAMVASACLFCTGCKLGPYLGKSAFWFGSLVAAVSLIITFVATFTGG